MKDAHNEQKSPAAWRWFYCGDLRFDRRFKQGRCGWRDFRYWVRL